MLERVSIILLMTGMTLIEVNATEPTAILDGLAVYRIGGGEPVFLMPYPHASGQASMAESELAEILVGLGRSVITFDPPGVFRSTRKPEVDMDEMLECTLETLQYFGQVDPLDVVGHSMSSFCALAFSLEQMNRVRRLVLIGSTSGWPAIRRWGIQKYWKRGEVEHKRLMAWGFRIFIGLGNLEIHKELDRLIDRASYVDKSLVAETVIDDSDRRKPVPVRAKWPVYLRRKNLDFSGRLSELDLPVLICVGRYDPQTPVVMNRELHEGMRNSQLVIFERSGHSPFMEERRRFSEVLDRFLSRDSEGSLPLY